jgi:hypothetical protein
MYIRYNIVLAGLVYLYGLVDALDFNSVYGEAAKYQFYSITGLTVAFFEIRYISAKFPAPKLTWFYDAYLDHEYQQMMNNWQDNLEEQSRKLLSISKEQIDYYLIHKEFSYIKKRSLSSVLYF